MFSNHLRLKKHTPANGIDRKQYISLLVDEFYETNDIGKGAVHFYCGKIANYFLFFSIKFAEAQEQVTANLSNFAYDPINYTYLKSASAIELFLDLLDHQNSKLVLHGIAGLCNLCLGKKILIIAFE